MIRDLMCIIRPMPSVTIVGASGYAGQETLDRVLAHPALELYALGSDSLAGEPAGTLDLRLGRNGWSRIPRFITNDAALAAVPTSRSSVFARRGSSARRPVARRDRRPLGSPPVRRCRRLPRVVRFEHPHPDGLASWSYGLPELHPPTGRLIANPGCYATAALLALAPIASEIEPTGVVVDAKSGMTVREGLRVRRRMPEGARERRAVPRRRASACTRDRRTARLPGDARSASAPRAPRPARDLRGPLAWRRSAGLLDEHYAQSHVVDVLPEGVTPELARVQQTDGAEIGVFEDRATERRSSSARSTTSARARRGRRSRTSTCCSGSTRRRAPAGGSPRLMSVTAAQGFLASGVHAGIRRSGPDLAIVRSAVPAVGRGSLDDEPRLAAPWSSRSSTSRSQSRRRS